MISIKQERSWFPRHRSLNRGMTVTILQK
ncbi:hypothetical protein A0J61_04945 [Choanephora cucurbitarum]|uniref:Uncharacterized protein n=1 Tax=Choanephora cucurbitarum TaxID=101091 RepID=A0A1C7ND20_9FUNG|nr:hypothetical protein A0J61_04945 [Choanephora cucurbitarum]